MIIAVNGFILHISTKLLPEHMVPTSRELWIFTKQIWPQSRFLKSVDTIDKQKCSKHFLNVCRTLF